ncbi:DUF6657 family protein [Spirochaeta cellobiosiphila]|uniref:DUF6657 family protein n=1 Tax=Spirochaeta cellobiosiphila TaxID=504483 RepID=UPI00040DCE4A|nr:DUF6657 family protein [Spirochaeta cellobiosiphila]
MAEIKSAWELALEKTKDIVVDKEALKQKDIKTLGRKAAFAYLEGTEATDIKKQMSEASNKEYFLEGLAETFLSYLKYPRAEDGYEETLDKLRTGLKELTESKEVDYIFEQLKGLFKQFIDDHLNLKDQIKQQLGPQLSQKSRAIAAQTGMSPEAAMEADPEFRRILEQNLKSMDAQYNNYLDQIKTHIKGLLGLAEPEDNA